MGNELGILPHLKPFSAQVAKRITRKSEVCATSAATEIIWGKILMAQEETNYSKEKKIAEDHLSCPEFRGFSDQVYRHRRNLLTFSLAIAACLLAGGNLKHLPLGLEISSPLFHPDNLLLLINGYLLIIFLVSATSEYKQWPNVNFKTCSFVAHSGYGGDKIPLPHLAATAETLLNALNRGTLSEGDTAELASLSALLKEHSNYQSTIHKFWSRRFMLDFWLPLLLGFITLVGLILSRYHGIEIIHPTSSVLPVPNSILV